MRVIVPYTEIHPLADRALREVVPDAERVQLGRDDFAYSRLVAELWVAQEDVLLVEHDIEINWGAYLQALHCSCEFSVSPYVGPGGGDLLYRSLGCTRFRGSLMAKFPDAMQIANRMDDGGPVLPPMHWKRLDARFIPTLTGAGYEPHVHDEVLHHHVYEGACACGGSHDVPRHS